MTDKYFSQRKQSASGYRSALSHDFWTAWLSTMRDFGRKQYLCEDFGRYCTCGARTDWDKDTIQERILAELGNVTFISFKSTLLSEDRMFDLIEFFYGFVSKPTDEPHECYCNDWHYGEFDRQRGRYEYTVEVNKLFDRFNHPYKLKKGRIILVISQTLDAPLTSLEIRTDDEHLRTLIEQAVSDFYHRSGSRKSLALRSIVDAFERLKTLEGHDKKDSVAKVVRNVSRIEAVQKAFDADMRELTRIANDFCIRHHEMGKKPIKDPDMVEFLFYLYFDFVRLILKRYNMIAGETSRESGEDAAV